MDTWLWRQRFPPAKDGRRQDLRFGPNPGRWLKGTRDIPDGHALLHCVSPPETDRLGVASHSSQSSICSWSSASSVRWGGPEHANFSVSSRDRTAELLQAPWGLRGFPQELVPDVWRMAAGQHGLGTPGRHQSCCHRPGGPWRAAIPPQQSTLQADPETTGARGSSTR